MITASVLLTGVLTTGQLPSPAKSYYVEHGYFGFGETVGRAGDLNQDGIPDLVLGDGGNGAEFPPTFWFVSGKDGSVLNRLQIPTASPVSSLVDGGSDADGDGVPEILLESRDEDRQLAKLYVVSGKTASVLCVITSANPAPPFGEGAHFVSDYDHDGLVDVGLLQHVRREPRGSLLIYSGRSGSLLAEIPLHSEDASGWRGFLEVGSTAAGSADRLALVTASSLELHELTSPASNAPKTRIWRHAASASASSGFGKLIAVGDLDADGADDLAVSFYDSVDIVSTKTGRLLFHFQSAAKQDSEVGYGWTLAPLGDINGDGFGDVAISETEAGAFSGSVHARSGKDGRELWETATGSDASLYHFGTEIAALGDIDADGSTDLVVGTCELFSKEPGVACVISGKTGTELYRFRRSGDTTLAVTRRFPLRTQPR